MKEHKEGKVRDDRLDSTTEERNAHIRHSISNTATTSTIEEERKGRSLHGRFPHRSRKTATGSHPSGPFFNSCASGRIITAIFSIFFFLGSSAVSVEGATRTPLCVALAGFTSSKPVLDGWTGPELDDFSWVSEHCDGAVDSLDFSTGWVDLDPSSISTSFDPFPAVTHASLIRSVQASIEPKGSISMMYMNITMQFKATLRGSIQDEEFHASVLGTVLKEAAGVPISASSDLPLAWRGSLVSLLLGDGAGQSVSIRDGNLFDHMGPSILLEPKEADSGFFPVLDEVLSSAAVLSKRFSPLGSFPSAFSASIRGSFLPLAMVPHATVDNTLSGYLYEVMNHCKPFKNSMDTEGVLAHLESSCSGSTCLPLVTSVQEMVEEASHHVCEEGLSPVIETFASSFSMEVFVSNQSITVGGLSGSTWGLFNCSGHGFIGFSLAASTTAITTWPLGVFMSDVNAAVGMVKSVPVSPHGTLTGSLTIGNQTFTMLGSDIFSSMRAGVLLPDTLLDMEDDTATLSKLFGEILAATKTGINSVDAELERLFPMSSISSLIQDFYLQTQVPSLLDFLSWFASDREAIGFYVSSDGDSATLSLNFGINQMTPLNDSFNRVNDIINSLGHIVKSRFPEAASYPIPSIQAEAEVTANISALFSAGVHISGLKNLTAAVVTLARPLDVSASIIAAADFSAVSPVPIFTCANVTFHLKKNENNTIKACVAKPLQSALQGPVLGLDQNGQLLLDSLWTSSNSLVDSLDSVATAFANVTGVLDPVQIPLGVIGDATFVEVLHGMASMLENLPASIRSFDLAEYAEEYFRTLGSGNTTYRRANVIPDAKNASLCVHVVEYKLQSATISQENAPWRFMADTSRVSIPVIMETTLQFCVTPTSHSEWFRIRGQGHANDWTIPFIVGMLSGFVDSGTAELSFDLSPSTYDSVLALDMDVSTDFGGVMHVGISLKNMTSEDPKLQFIIPPNNKLIPSQTVLATIQDGLLTLLPSILNGPLNMAIVPLKESFADQTTFSNAVSHITPWFSMPSTFDPFLVQSMDFNSSSLVDTLAMNISVNQQSTSCILSHPDKTSLQSVVNGINHALETCGLSELVIAKIMQQESDQLGNFGMYAVVPGLIWRFDTVFSGSLVQGSWLRNSLPSFAAWKDLPWVLSDTLGESYSYVRPEFATVAADTVVPRFLKNVYPQALPAVTLRRVQLNHVDQVVVPMQDQIDSEESLFLSVKNGQMGGNLNTSFAADVIFVFGGPPVGTSINIQTNLQDSSETQMLVPNYPNNTFTIGIEAQLRNSTATQSISVRQEIELTPGKKLIDAFVEDLPDQLDNGNLKAMLAVSMTIGRPSLGISSQIQISLSRLQLDEDNWLIPTSLAILNSNLPGLGNATNTPPNYYILVSEVEMNASASLVASVESVDGTLGIAGLSSQVVEGDSTIGWHIHLNSSLVSLSTVLSAPQSDSFFSTFQVTLGSQSNLSMQSIAVQVSSLDIGNPVISFHSSGSWILNSTDSVEEVKQGLAWDINLGGSKAIDGLLKTSSETLCSWMEHVSNASEAVRSAEASRALLPFSSNSIGGLWNDGVGAVFRSISNGICGGDQRLTMDLLCSVIDSSFGSKVCTSSSLDETTLELNLELVEFNQTHHNQFTLDTATFFPAHGFPLAVGMGGGSSMTSWFTIKVQLVAVFSETGVILSLGPDTSFTLAAEFDTFGKVAAHFGPLVVNFANLQASLGKPATLTATMNPEHHLDIQVNGVADFNSVLTYNGQDLCELKIAITDLGAFLHGNIHSPVVQVSEQQCGAGFIPTLEKLLLQNSLFQFFLHPTLFIQQLERDMDGFVDGVFGIEGVIGPLILPIVDRLAEELIRHELDHLLGPEISKELVNEITNMTTDILIHQHLDPDAVDQFVLEAFTEILCHVFHSYLTECPPVPNVNAPEYQWKLSMKKTSTKQLSNVGAHLGNHGLASFDLSCPETFTMDWEFTATLAYRKSHGLSLDAPAFSANMDLGLSPQCKMSGNIGLLGAEIEPRGGLHGHLQIDSQMQVSMDIAASITGEADFGFAGPLAQEIVRAGTDAIQALPHWRVTVDMQWTWSLHHPVLTPQFKVGNVTACIGTMLGKLLRDVVHHTIGSVLDSMEPVLGPSSILLEKIKATEFVFGRQLTVAEMMEFIVHHYCSGECIFEHVWEALETYENIYQMLSRLNAIADLDGDCEIIQEVQSFMIAWDQEKVNPHPFGPVPEPKIQFTTDKVRQHQAEITATWSSVTEGKFGVHFPLFENGPANIVKLMLGGDVPLVAVTIPKLTMAASAHWSIVVYTPPTVSLFVGITGAVVVDLGEVAMNGIADAVRTKSPGKLFGAIGIPSTNQDGSIRWPLSGFIRLNGGVSVGIFGLTGTAYVFIQVDGKVRVMDIDGDGYATFDDFFYLVKANHGNLWAALDKDITLTAGFGLELKFCIKVWRFHKCWRIAHKEWSVKWEHEWKPAGITPISSSDGNINLDAMHSYFALPGGSEATDGTQAVIRIYGSSGRSVDLFPANVSPSSASPPLSRMTSPVTPITFSGNARSAHFTVDVQNVTELVQFPSGPTAKLLIDISSYPSASSLQISPTLVALNSAMGVALTQCSAIELVNPLSAMSLELAGSPCPVSLTCTPSSNVSLSGNTAAYVGPIQILGDANYVFTNVPAQTYVISGSKLVADNLFDLTLPITTRNLVVTGHPTLPATFDVREVPAGRALAVTSGTGSSTFLIDNFGNLNGTTSLISNQLPTVDYIDITLLAKYGLKAISTPFSLSQSSPTESHLITWRNIEERTFSIQGEPGSTFEFTLIAPEEDSVIRVHSIGTPTSNMVHQITGCSGQSDLWISLEGGGNQMVSLGSNQRVTSFLCNVHVNGGKQSDQIDTVVIQAGSESRYLKWELAKGSLTGWNPQDTSSAWFHLFFEDIEQLIVHFGPGGSDLVVTAGTFATESLLSFPLTNATNTARVYSTTNAVLMNGSFTLGIGPEGSIPEDAVDPLKSIQGLVAIAGTLGNIPVILESGTGPYAPVQEFVLDQQCLNPLQRPFNISSISPWMSQLLDENGFSSYSLCSVSYSHQVSFEIFTGDANDYVSASHISTAVAINLGKGDDTLVYGPAHNATASLDMGDGENWLTMICPTSLVSARVGGNNERVNTVDIWAGAMEIPPQVKGHIVTQLGPSESDTAVLLDYAAQDLIYLRRGYPFPVSNIQHSTFINGNAVTVINVTVAGVVWKEDMADNTTYRIIACAPESTIVLDGRGRADKHILPATNWQVIVDTETVATPAYVNIYGLKGTNGIVTLNVPSSQVTYSISIQNIIGPAGYGTIKLGGTEIRTFDADHMVVNSQAVVEMTVDGTPSNADLVVNCAPGSLVTLMSSVSNILLVNVTTTILASNASIVSVGSAASNSINLHSASSVSYDNGCLSVPSFQPTANGSSWFLSKLAALGVPSTIMHCSLYTHQTKLLNISSSSLYATGLGTDLTVSHLAVRGKLLTLDDSLPWTSMSIIQNSLYVENRFQVSLDTPMTAMIASHLISNESTLHIECGQASGFSPQWNFGGEASGPLVWEGLSCGGIISAAQLPQLTFHKNGSMVLTLHLWDTAQVSRNITLSPQWVDVNVSSTSFVHIELDEPLDLLLHTSINDGDNTIQLSPFQTTPTLSIKPTATASISSSAKESILLPAAVTFNWHKQVVTLGKPNQQEPFCLSPLLDCTSDSWSGIGAHGNPPCKSKLDEELCRSNPSVILDAASMQCSSAGEGSNWVIHVNSEGAVLKDTFQMWTLVLFGTLFFLISAVAIASWVSYPFFGTFVDLGWIDLVVTAFLGNAKREEYRLNPSISSLIQSANEVVVNFMNGCTVDVAPFMWFLVVIFGVMTVIAYLLKLHFPLNQRMSRALEILRRGVCAAGIFLLLPYAISHSSKLEGVFLVIAVVVLITQFTFDDIFPSQWRRRPQENPQEVQGSWARLSLASLNWFLAVIISAFGNSGAAVFFGLAVTSLLLALLFGVARILLFERRRRVVLAFPIVLGRLCGICFISVLYADVTVSPAVLFVLWFSWILCLMVSPVAAHIVDGLAASFHYALAKAKGKRRPHAAAVPRVQEELVPLMEEEQ